MTSELLRGTLLLMFGGNVGLQTPPVVKRSLMKGMEIVNRCSRQSNVQIKTF